MVQGRHFDGVALPVASHMCGEGFQLMKLHMIAGEFKFFREQASVMDAQSE